MRNVWFKLTISGRNFRISFQYLIFYGKDKEKFRKLSVINPAEHPIVGTVAVGTVADDL